MKEFRKFEFSKIKRLAQGLRNNMTESEKLLWSELRGKKVLGLRFLRQHPIIYKGNLRRYNYFIADFYCDKKKLIIELDGQIHEKTEEYDKFRDDELKEIGIQTLRIKNDELKNMNNVLAKIEYFITHSSDIQ